MLMHTSCRIVGLALLLLALTIISATGGAAGGSAESDRSMHAAPSAVDDDENTVDVEAIEALIEDLGHEQFARREAATAQLREKGPAILPILERHRDHPDLETRVRIEQLIEAWEWINSGAIIFRVDAGKPAAEARIEPGDVLVRIDDVNITGHREASRAADTDQPVRYTLRRGDEIIERQMPASRRGIGITDWVPPEDGGLLMARALRKLAGDDADVAAAYDHLHDAFEEGMDTHWSLRLLKRLAANQLRHDEAIDWWERYRNHLQTPPTFAIREDKDSYFGFDNYSIQVALMLDAWQEGDRSGDIVSRLAAASHQQTVNFPLLTRIAEADVDIFDSMSDQEEDTYRHALAAGALADRWHEAAIDLVRPGEGSTCKYGIAMEAAVMEGDTDRIVEVARWIVEGYENDRFCNCSLGALSGAFMAAHVTGDEQLVAHVERKLTRLDRVSLIHAMRVGGAAYETRFDEAIAPFLKVLGTRLEPDDFPFLRSLYLQYLLMDHETTEAQFNRAAERFDHGDSMAGYRERMRIQAKMRFGRYEAARKLFEASGKPDRAEGIFSRSVEFLEQHHHRFEEDWRKAGGTVAVFPGHREATRWLLRYDGQALLLDEDDQVTHYPGLEPRRQIQAFFHRNLRIADGRAFYSCAVMEERAEVFMFDDDQQRWVDLRGHDRFVDTGDPRMNVKLAAWLHVRDNHPIEGVPRLLIHEAWDGDRAAFCQFEGDIVVLARADGSVIDLSEAVADKAGLDRPAAVYHVDPHRDLAGGIIVPTEAGLFLLDPETDTLRRQPLGLEDEQVMVTLMETPEVEGKLLFGVAPQQGGAVVAVDPETGEAERTGGFNPFGPDDARARRQDLFIARSLAWAADYHWRGVPGHATATGGPSE